MSQKNRTELNCVMITEECCLKADRDVDCQPFICQLRHPCSGGASLFMFSDSFKTVHEVLVFDEDGHRSWFIDSMVLADGRIVVTSQMDPLFLVLPYLIKVSDSGKFMSLETLVDDCEFPESRHLVTCCASHDLSNISDIKQSDDGTTVCRYNSEKTFAWLRHKTDEVATALRQRDFKVSSTSAALTTFIDGMASRQVTASSDYAKYAHGLVGDYLPSDVSKQLADCLGLTDDENVSSYADEELPAGKRSKVDGKQVAVPLEDYSVFASSSAQDCNKNTKLTTAQKQLSKVNKTGIKSISSFFTRTAAARKS